MTAEVETEKWPRRRRRGLRHTTAATLRESHPCTIQMRCSGARRRRRLEQLLQRLRNISRTLANAPMRGSPLANSIFVSSVKLRLTVEPTRLPISGMGKVWQILRALHSCTEIKTGNGSLSIIIHHEFLRRDMPPNLSLNPDASPAALARRPLGAG